MGALNCHSYNNIIVGTKYGVDFNNPGFKKRLGVGPAHNKSRTEKQYFVGCTEMHMNLPTSLKILFLTTIFL